ncbi:MAG: hypothetical protein E7568_01840 [Ruminococcaceae bacterium]|nr:hypothetical protein [Oscillospiraceae bacterium]
MKKLACILFSILLVFTFSLTAFADGLDDTEINIDDITGLFGPDYDDGELGAGDIFGNPTLSFEDVTAKQNRKVTLDLSIAENPGFTELRVTVDAPAGITVTAVANGEVGTAVLDNGVIVVTANETVTEDKIVAKVTFAVAGNAVLGANDISIDVVAKDGDKRVLVKGSDFKMTVEESTAIPGDVNGNGEVEINDLAVLKLRLVGALADGDAEIVNPDVNENGVVEINDLAQLKLILVGAA